MPPRGALVRARLKAAIFLGVIRQRLQAKRRIHRTPTHQNRVIHRRHPPPDPLLLLVSKRLGKVYSHPNGWQAPEEYFIGLDGVRGDQIERARKIRARILQWIGIPCGVGIASTKTLAKLAYHIAKTAERKPGSYPAELAQVCDLAALPASDLDAVLAATEVGDVWGVGRRIGQQLQEAGIKTVLDLTRLSPATVRSRWSVMLERTVRELQGQPCIDMDYAPSPKQQIACTRSFGKPVTALPHLIEAVSEFAARAAEKLRHQHSQASEVLVFAHTSPHRPGPRFSKSIVVPLRRPSADTTELVQAAAAGIRQIYKPGFQLIKAGVMLLDLMPDTLQRIRPVTPY